ncbi:hypothetical protein [Clostridium massiliamazoniense]|uniref:hypothetical protein n=1 Tax=Clostridium massiliamazoniense TaxID=1347366 RepID=UPI000AC535CF|nr:hypothetical protein [Clostridium massiliamazoniense]
MNKLHNILIEVIKSIRENIVVLNVLYGEERNIETDLGGYVVIAENIVVIEILKQDKLKGLIPEYIDVIECSEDVNWISSLFLLSSDFSIVVVCTKELSKFLLE